MSVDDVLRSMLRTRKAAATTPMTALEDATRIGVKETSAAEAAAVGMVKEGRLLEDAATETRADLQHIANVESQLVKQRPGHKPSSALISTVTRPPLSRFERLFKSFTASDRVALGERALKLARGKSVAQALRAENNMAGQLREVVAKFLPEVIKDARMITLRLRGQTRGSSRQIVIDSVRHGDVELPTRLKGDQRFVRLGTDRLVGVGTVSPLPVKVRWADGTEGWLEVAGDLDVSLAIEVKGRTTAVGGIEQIITLQQRGQPGYAIIGNQLWLLRYDPTKVTHVVVAPPGEQLSAAKKLAATQTAAGRRTKVVEIPLELDNEVKQMARNYLEEAAKTTGWTRRRP